ncbi:MAG: TraI domain-containing protein [Vitreoscilla sp.]|jgi:conjugal transfer pilus assembly protein TraI|nr:TraI domain-containing protein [Vitreoscilla sp.]
MNFPQAAAQSARSAFPASDPGFASASTDELLAQNDDLIARIKLCYGADRDAYDRDILMLVRRYAAYVHLLPATADNYFSQPGGLLRLGLETAFFSLQGTDAHIFSGRSTISVRRQLEPRWRHATFIAGLCCELHRVLSHVIVADAQGEEWPCYLQPLAVWLAARSADRYFLRWRPRAHETRGLGVFALSHVVPPEVLQDLSIDNAVIVPQLMASIGGVALYHERNVLDELVRRSLALVIDRNLAGTADRYGSPQFGSHLERYLVDALRRLASGHSAWVPNREKSRVWFGPDGLFLLWPSAAEDVHKLLESDQLAGIPKAPETMLELLLAAGVLTTQDSTQATWTIQPPGAKTTLEAVRLASPAILFSGIDLAPVALENALVRKHGAVDEAPPTPAPTVKVGTQLSLIPAASAVPAPQATPAAPLEAAPALTPPVPPPTFALRAPLRLNPVVRDALTPIVHTLNHAAGPAQCCTVATGIFIPLDEFERRGVPPSLTLRALADVHMLAAADAKGPPTLTRDFNGMQTVGLVLDPRFVDGLDLEGFALPATEDA